MTSHDKSKTNLLTAVGKSGKIRYQLLLHMEIAVALIHRSQVNGRFYTKGELGQTFCSSSGYASLV